MPKVVSVKEIQKLDDIAINKYGVPSIALMENAGRSSANIIKRKLKRHLKPFVCVICGMGNNAGDGFVIARHLINAGIRVKIYLIGKGSKLKADAALNYRILKGCGYPIIEINKINSALVRDLKRAGIVVDAIFGVGLNRAVSEPFASIVDAINKNSTYTVAVDVPSGLNATSGDIFGTCIKAKMTITFSYEKSGFRKKQGKSHVGRLYVMDIGIPDSLKKKIIQ